MSASRGRIVFMRRKRSWRRWAVAGCSVAVVAVVAWMAWGDEAEHDVHIAVPPRGQEAPLPVVAAAPMPPLIVPPAVELPQPAAFAVAEPIDAPAALPMRVAVDSGRAQPVFLGWTSPRTARMGQAFSVDITAESEN